MVIQKLTQSTYTVADITDWYLLCVSSYIPLISHENCPHIVVEETEDGHCYDTKISQYVLVSTLCRGKHFSTDMVQDGLCSCFQLESFTISFMPVLMLLLSPVG